MEIQTLKEEIIEHIDNWLVGRKTKDTEKYIIKEVVDKTLKKVEEIIKNDLKNPYPKDIFEWDNSLKVDLTKGRFNEFTYNVVENTRNKMIFLLEDEIKE